MMLMSKFLLVVGLQVFWLSQADRAVPRRFLLVSAPAASKVSYMKVLAPGEHGSPTVNTLVGQGLSTPQGIAVDQRHSKLYIADTDSSKIYSYDLRQEGDSLSASGQTTVVENVETRWVAVDGVGNVYFTDEPMNQILKIPAEQVGTNSTPVVLYDSTTLQEVNAPGGIAVDSFYVYWANKKIGTEIGSVVRGSEIPSTSNVQSSVSVLSSNTEKSYGVCLALSNVFYTQPENIIYGVRKTGSNPAAVTDRLINPRGCVWDGDGTIYVADRGANAVFSFAGNMQNLGEALVQRTVNFDDAFGVAVFAGASRPLAGLLGMVLGVLLFSIH